VTALEPRTLSARIALNQGTQIPVLGLGVWQMPPASTVRAVGWALEAGYRLIDTATLYRNEAEVGTGVRQSGVPREEVFVTTKLLGSIHGYTNALEAFEESRRRLALEYVDLYLIHWPMAPSVHVRQETWRALEHLHTEGLARAVGVSNYTIQHLEEIRASSQLVPAVNQIELNPFQYPSELVDYCGGRGIRVEAYSPLTHGERLSDPRIVAIAKRVGRTPAQVFVRWGLQHGFIEIPKSARRERILENAAVFGFDLGPAEMAALDALGGPRTPPGSQSAA